MTWRAVAAASAGTSHLERGAACEDHCVATVQTGANGEPLLCVFVADGAGSAARGGEGAQLAVRTAAHVVEARAARVADFAPDRDLADACLAAIRAAIDDAARSNAVASRDFACTFLGLVSSSRQTLALQLGDGGIVLDVGEGIELAITPMTGEYANTTHFVTDADAPRRMSVRTYTKSVRCAAAFSDGLQRLALDFADGTPHAPLFVRLFSALAATAADIDVVQQALQRFLDGSSVNERTDDDKALALAVLMG